MEEQQVLALSLRPRSFKKLFGQQPIIDAITKQIASRRIPRAWMFAGETGSGKTTIARILAQWLQCPHKIKLGMYCKECGFPPQGLIEINASHHNTVESIKGIAEGAAFSPVPPAIRRVYLLDEAHRLSALSQDVLLKHFEEAVDTTCWIVCTTEPSKIIKTLRGRCMVYHMRPLRGAEADAFIERAAMKAESSRDLGPFKDVVHLKGVTSPRQLLYALEHYLAGMDPDKALASVDSSVDTLRICQALIRGEWGPIRSELEKATVDDARTIRGACLGYLRSIMLARNSTVDKKAVIATVKELGSFGYQDDQTFMTLLVAALYSCCKRF